MSLERIIKALTGLGLSRLDAELYVYVTKKGEQKIDDLVQAFNIEKHKLNSNVNNLQNKKLLVRCRTGVYAIHFEEALELLIEQKKQQTQSVQESIEESVFDWKKEE